MVSPGIVFVYTNSAASPHSKRATSAAAQLLWHTRRVSHPALRPTPRVASHPQRCATPPAQPHNPFAAQPSRCATPLAGASLTNTMTRAVFYGFPPRLQDDKSAFLKTMPSLFEDRPHLPHNPPRQCLRHRNTGICEHSCSY